MWTLVKVTATILALFAAYVAYWFYQDHRAQSAANEFCDALGKIAREQVTAMQD